MAQLKVVHNDSNKSRLAEKKAKENQLKQAFSRTDLHDTEGYFVVDNKLYEIIANALDSINVTHITDIDKFTLVGAVNTMAYIQCIEKEIQRLGITQEQITREGSTKYTTLQHMTTRAALYTTLQKQLSDLMLTPAQRMALVENINTNIEAQNLDAEYTSDLFKKVMQQ